MAIRPVREVPKRVHGFVTRPSFVDADMREFVRKGMDVAVIDVEGKKPAQIVAACKKFIKAHPEQYRGIKAGVRGGRAYVWREDPR